MNPETEKRLQGLVDRGLMHSDAFYQAQITQFRAWLNAAEDAMRDEDVPGEVIARILNRMVYGAPSGADAHIRIEQREALLEQVKISDQLPKSSFFGDPDEGRFGSVTVRDEEGNVVAVAPFDANGSAQIPGEVLTNGKVYTIGPGFFRMHIQSPWDITRP